VLLFGVGVVGVQFLKAIMYLQRLCVLLGGWVFIKLRKGRKGDHFGVLGVLGQFYIGYGILVETLFSIRHMGYPIKKRQLITNLKKNLIMFQKFNCVLINYHQHQ
jgi:hypothetical protein